MRIESVCGYPCSGLVGPGDCPLEGDLGNSQRDDNRTMVWEML